MTRTDSEEAPTFQRKGLSAGAIFFIVVAAAAPLGATIGNGPLAILLGTGPGTPGAFLLAGIILALFAIGFTRMSFHVRGGGAFYVYIRRGLGEKAGSAAAFMAALVYLLMVTGIGAATGYFTHIILQAELGIALAWPAWTAIALALVAVFGYLDIRLGARVLAALLILEMTILLIFDVIVLVKGGANGITGQPFSPSTVFHGSIGPALVFAFASFLGFESAAIYTPEARDGHRTARRALLGAIVFIAFFYAFTMWCLVLAYGVNGVVAAASKGPGLLVFNAYSRYAGSALTTTVRILDLTSSFASLLALHNVAARYLSSLGRNGLLPAWLGRSHPRFQSPNLASVATTVITVVILAVYASFKADPLVTIVSTTFGVATLGIIVLQTATSASVVAYFSRHREERGLASTLLVAGVACSLLILAAVLVIINYNLLAGNHGALDYLPVLLAIAAGVGLLVQRRRARHETGHGMIAKRGGR